MDSNSHSFQFKDKVPLPKFGVAMIFDIGGFSSFFSQHDVEFYVPRFLNHVFRSVSTVINGGTGSWLTNKVQEAVEGNPNWTGNETSWPALSPPVHTKYLGDGALYLWELGSSTSAMSTEQVQDLFFRISVLQKAFPSIISKCTDDVPVADVPTNIRFGLSAGSLYRLGYAYNTSAEYMGYAINLASRLQKYCKEISFIASARIEISAEVLDKLGFMKVIAINLKGFSREVVIVSKADYENLNSKIKNKLFAPLGTLQKQEPTHFPEADQETERKRFLQGGDRA